MLVYDCCLRACGYVLCFPALFAPSSSSCSGDGAICLCCDRSIEAVAGFRRYSNARMPILITAGSSGFLQVCGHVRRYAPCVPTCFGTSFCFWGSGWIEAPRAATLRNGMASKLFFSVAATVLSECRHLCQWVCVAFLRPASA